MSTRRRKKFLILAGIVVLGILVAVLVPVLVIGKGEAPSVPPIPGLGEEEERPVTDRVWAATLLKQFPLDPAQADQPADIAVPAEDEFVVLDSARGRLLELDGQGQVLRILDQNTDPSLVLSLPMAVSSLGGTLYVADSAGKVVVLSAEGTVQKVVELAKGASVDALPPRPLGVVVWGDGSFAVSDANNHRLLKYDAEGGLEWSAGAGTRSSEPAGFNVPGGLALDKDGNLYVVDVLNSQIKKYSPQGQFLWAFGEAGDRAGQFSRPKAVAVDGAGNVYVSDSLQVAIQVFYPNGEFGGFIGRKEPTNPESDSLFRAPHGLKIVGNRLYVVDRYTGVFVFDLSGALGAQSGG